MRFLVISQRAFPNSNFSLKDLTGHGRIDIIMRCILAACRPISKFDTETNTIYCYLKGSDNPQEWGWLKWDNKIVNEDEISIAAIIKDRWSDLFTLGSLKELVLSLKSEHIFYLHENGLDLMEVVNDISNNSLIILGAQSDLAESDLFEISQLIQVKLSNESMLASQVITIYRQKMMLS